MKHDSKSWYSCLDLVAETLDKKKNRSLRTFFHQIYSFDRNLVVIYYAFGTVLWLLW